MDENVPPTPPGTGRAQRFVEALAASLGAAPAARNDPPHTLLMVSGGLDSVGLLAALLDTTECAVHAHHIEIDNVEERAAAEEDAISVVLPWLWEHSRPFEYTSSRWSFHVGWGGYDSSLALFTAARLHQSLMSPFDYVVTGHRHPGITAEETAECEAVLAAALTRTAHPPAWLTPLSGVRKSDISAWLPPELVAAAWSCRRPVPTVDGYEACGECHACRSLVDDSLGR